MATTPVALILLFGLSVFPFMRWIKPSKPFIDPNAIFPFLFAIGATAFALFAGIEEVLYLILLGLGAFATASNAWLVYDRLRNKHKLHGAYIAHVGLALLIVGAAVSSAYEKKEQVALPLNQPVQKFGWTLTYQGRGVAENNQTPYEVAVFRDGSDQVFLCSPRQYQLPDGGVMRKPAVKKFWHKDLYVSPLGIEGEEEGAGIVTTLERGQANTVGALDLTFLGFDLDDHGASSRVGCRLEITSDMLIDTVVPMIEGTPDGLQGVPIDVADGHYTLSVDQIDATNGAINLRVIDNQNPNAVVPVFWIELAEKPLINLFWLGTTLMVLGGLLALRVRARKWDPTTDASTAETSSTDEVTGSSRAKETPERAEAPQLR
jgi:cytochrome c-type biogenesis protein CcmF